MGLLYKFLYQTFLDLNFLEKYAQLSSVVVTFVGICVAAFLIHRITSLIVIKVINRLVKNTRTEWDDYLMNHRVFHSLSHLASALVFYYSVGFSGNEDVAKFMSIFTNIYFVIIFVKVASGALKAANDIYLTTPFAASRSIKGYVQLGMIAIYSLAFILIIAFIFDKSPFYLLGGLSAVAAVLLLVFKDTILGFVASIQLSANKMLKPGDFIEMPKHNASGTVIDISLNTVKVQNSDKTITTIPTYTLVSESFQNWAGVEQADGRRIKRSINIDMKSVRFCDEPMLEKFKNFRLISDYIIEKQKEISDYNQKHALDNQLVPNGRRQTNLGIFRKYLEAYLKNHPSINQNMPLVVRQLQPSEAGMPIEVYAFSINKEWSRYEELQSDIFDHILAVMPAFELRVFQSPSGHDIKDLAEVSIRSN